MDEYAAIADLYDHVTPYRERPDVRFFVDAARDAGSPVLELGCGTGRILIPTARAGIDIVGLDASPSMLAMCRTAMDRETAPVRGRIELVEGDFRDFNLGRRFKLITVPFRPFQHLVTVEDQLACLERVLAHLEPDGRFILDLFNPSLEALTQPVGEESPPEAEFTTPDGRKVVRRFRVVSRDRAGQVNHVELIYDVTRLDGRSERLLHAFPMRWLYRFEVEHLLARSGLEVEHLYGGFDKTPFGAKYPGELLFVARPARRTP